ncbi:MAG TPA: FecR family protein [Polyangiaceae bacterium]|nr:FecR family protein [Polyangiaceae bacterium]
MTYGESGSPTLSDVEAVVRENVSGHVDGEHHEHGKQRLLAALHQRHLRRGAPRWRLLLMAGALVLLVSGAALAWRKHARSRLTYDVTGGMLSDSGYVRSSGPSGARLSFSDGTRVDLQDGARARIAAVDAHGARIAIENGHATLSVTQRPAATWFVDAGPFVIHVTGTQFDVDWSSYDDTLSVDLHEGSLIVSGPPAPAGVLLRAGQRLTAQEGRLSIEALEAAVQVAETPIPLPETGPEGLAPADPMIDLGLGLEPSPGLGEPQLAEAKATKPTPSKR